MYITQPARLVSICILVFIAFRQSHQAPIDPNSFGFGGGYNSIDDSISELINNPFGNVSPAPRNNGIITSAPIQTSSPLTLDRFKQEASSTTAPRPFGHLNPFEQTINDQFNQDLDSQLAGILNNDNNNPLNTNFGQTLPHVNGDGGDHISNESNTNNNPSAAAPGATAMNVFFGKWGANNRPRPVIRPHSDFAGNEEDFERLVSNLYEESRQDTLDKLSKQNSEVDAYLIDTDNEATDQTEILKRLKTTCSICLEEWGPYLDRSSLKCGHTFHRGCISTWLHTSLKCPVCRVDAKKVDESQHQH